MGWGRCGTGNHLEFSDDFLMGLVDTYFKERVGTLDKPRRLVPLKSGKIMTVIDDQVWILN